jgi:hypothetical protein
MRVEVLFYPVGRFPRKWEAVELSNIDVCPMYGPFEQRRNDPTAEFFQMLNRIQYVWMPCSNGLYSPPDTLEPSLSDLFGSTASDSNMALVVEGVARARMDDDSIETKTDSVHVGSDSTVTSMCVGPDGTTNSISRIFSSYTDCLPVSCKNRFWTLGSHRPVLRVWMHMGQPLILGTLTDYQPSVAPMYGRLLGLTMLRVYPVNCGNKPRVWTHLTASLALEVI